MTKNEKVVLCDRPKKVGRKCGYYVEGVCTPKTRFNKESEQFFCFEPKKVV